MTTLVFDGFPEFHSFLGRVYAAPVAFVYQEPLNAFLPSLVEEHREHFAQEKDAGGNSWAPLAQSTIDRKGHDTILVEHGDLERSLTAIGGAGNIAAVTGQGLLFGTSDEKAGFHQAGTSRMPARPPVGISEERINQLAESLADSAVNQLLGIT